MGCQKVSRSQPPKGKGHRHGTYWKVFLLVRNSARILQLGNLHSTLSARSSSIDDHSNVRKNEAWKMCTPDIWCFWRSLSYRMCGRHYKVSYFVYRFAKGLLQLGDFQCSLRVRWGRYDVQSQIWQDAPGKMHSGNIWSTRESIPNQLQWRYTKVYFWSVFRYTQRILQLGDIQCSV